MIGIGKVFLSFAAFGWWASSSAAQTAPPGHPEPARTKGWSWKTPPDQVRPVSGKRSHVFFVGEPVTFSLGGAAGASVTLKVKDPGWYKLYVYGREVRKEWGDIVGAFLLA
jgi:hypothetical protein